MPPRSAAKGKAPAADHRPPPAPMEVDPGPTPAPPRPGATADEDEVVAEYELVLCEPVGPEAEVCGRGG